MSTHRARKRFGQNFLHDQQVIDRIVESIAPQKNDALLEIGPGQGALTRRLLQYVDVLYAVELDRDLIIPLREKMLQFGNLNLHEGDALKVKLNELASEYSHWRIVGNLPYNISTPLIFHLLEQIDQIQDMHFMLQKEVVDRITAEPGNKTYGRLSVMVQYFCQASCLFIVPPTAFKPVPAVDSAIIRLIPHTTIKNPVKDYALFSRIVEAAFNQRRKTLRNSLGNYLTPEDWIAVGIDSNRRAETLSVDEYVQLSHYVEKNQKV